MLGLLLMAGLGFAATALIDHADHHAEDDGDAKTDPDAQAAHSVHGHHHDSETEASDHDAQGVSDQAETGHSVLDYALADHGSAHGSLLGSAHGAGRPVGDPADPATVKDEDSAAAAPSSGASPAPGHESAAQSTADAPPVSHKVFGSDEDDTLHGSRSGDLIEGNGGDDKVYGRAGADHLVGFDAGQDTLYGGKGNDTLHGFMVQTLPDDSSFVIEDHQADHLHGGTGKDSLYLASDDVGTGGRGADSFHLSWDVEAGHPAQITDYNPKQDKICVEYTANHADEAMTQAQPDEQTITTEPMAHGAGMAIMLNGQAIAHVLGATHLNASDVQLIRS